MPEPERKDPPKDGEQDGQQNPPQSTGQEQNPENGGQQQDSSGTSSKSDDQGNGKSSGPSLEDLLDAEKAKNLQLAKDLTKANAEKAKAEGDKDVVKERDDFKAENAKLKGLLESKFLLWCIGTDKKFDWQNAEDVVKFIKEEELNIDIEKGQIDGLDLALKRIAKDKPYLLVPKEEEQQPPRPISGSHPSGSKSGDRVTEEKRLGEKYKIPGFGTQAQKFM
jgi:hypothetical protein